MPLGSGIVAMLSAVQERIEVSGHEPTWRVTAGTFDAALAYAREAWDDPVVLARETRGRWWPRVTLTVTTDWSQAATAPTLEQLSAVADDLVPLQRGSAEVLVLTDEPLPDDDEGDVTDDFRPGMVVSLDEIFAHQEARRMRQLRTGIPRQRTGAD